MIFVLIISGIIGGFVGGMGMGGGTFLIPLLTLFAGVKQHVAQAVNLISFIPMAIIALIIHAKKRLIKKDGIFLIILSGIVSCTVFSFVARAVDGETLKRIFGFFLIFLSVKCFISAVKSK